MNIKIPFENIWFNFRIVIGVAASGFLNLLLHLSAESAWRYPPETEIRFADGGGFSSGFPFTMYFFGGGNPFVSEIKWSGVIANTVVTVLFAYLFGLTLEYLA